MSVSFVKYDKCYVDVNNYIVKEAYDTKVHALIATTKRNANESRIIIILRMEITRERFKHEISDYRTGYEKPVMFANLIKITRTGVKRIKCAQYFCLFQKKNRQGFRLVE